MKILIWDIELSYMLAAVFSLKTDYISPKNIVKDQTVLCGAWKWLGDKTTHAVCVDPSDPDDDVEVVQTLRDVVSEADIIVHHNGDRFDIKKLNSRVIYHKLEPMPPVRMIDTLKEVRKVASFSSNKLDFLGDRLVDDTKIETSYALWFDILTGDYCARKAALKAMVTYNKKDVTLLEDVYLRLRPYMKNHPNAGLYLPTEDVICPKCSSIDMQKRGFFMTNKGKYQRYQCKDCGSWTKGGKALKTSEIGG
jgi:hypothetical protein